jgi:hypothetical protein
VELSHNTLSLYLFPFFCHHPQTPIPSSQGTDNIDYDLLLFSVACIAYFIAVKPCTPLGFLISSLGHTCTFKIRPVGMLYNLAIFTQRADVDLRLSGNASDFGICSREYATVLQ